MTATSAPEFPAALLTLASFDQAPGVVVVKAVGEIDISTRAALDDELDRALVRNPRRLIVDLLGVAFCGVTGLAALAQLRERCGATPVEVELRPSRCVRRALDIVAIAPLFRMTGPWAEVPPQNQASAASTVTPASSHAT